MLELHIAENEFYDSKKNEFHYIKPVTLQLEHSLISLAKWESKWEKPFLGKEPKTIEESRDYIRCMTVSPVNVDPMVYLALTNAQLKQVEKYMDAKMTATWFNDRKSGKSASKKVITAEVIYYWMIANNIPFECQKWHLNRLFTLIQVCNVESNPKKKMSKNEILSQNRALNELRKQQLHTSG